MIALCVSLFLGFDHHLSAQNKDVSVNAGDLLQDTTAAIKIQSLPDQNPAFPGGDTAMTGYILRNIHYPTIEKEEGISGTVYISFVVEMDGRITNVKVLRGVSGGPGCDKEALRVVKMMPDWSPGKLNGQPVRTQINLPVIFKMQ